MEIPKYVCGIDFETTGFSPEKDHITEIGAVLWDVEESMPVSVLNLLVKPDRDYHISEEITELTGIKRSHLESEFATPTITAMAMLMGMMAKAEYCMAHNVPFDRSFFIATANRLGLPFDPMFNKAWIDSRTDLPYSGRDGQGSLTLICANHGFLNPFPHRAIFDVMAMMKLVDMYEWADIMELHHSTTLEVTAIQLPFERKDEAKNAGFHWDADRRSWVRRLKSCHYKEGMYSFRVTTKEIV